VPDLESKHCVPCEGTTPPLADEAAAALLADVPGWNLEGSALTRQFRFKDFKAAMAFVNKVADLAESEQHHPDINVVWSRVTLKLTTHAIKGLSENDFIMAARINRLAGP